MVLLTGGTRQQFRQEEHELTGPMPTTIHSEHIGTRRYREGTRERGAASASSAHGQPKSFGTITP